MSILIKGMKMPRSCRDCELMVDCDGCEGWQCYCPLIGEIGYMTAANPSAKIILTDKREEKCPLIELPPHGDLIDRDALKKDLWKKWNTNDDHDFADKEVWHGIEDAPVIIESEGEG